MNYTLLITVLIRHNRQTIKGGGVGEFWALASGTGMTYSRSNMIKASHGKHYHP
jgi:hypothetical protein